MASDIKIGRNRTGFSSAPAPEEVLQGSARGAAIPEGDERDLAQLRMEYVMEADPVGSMPPLETAEADAPADGEPASGTAVLLDKLGERLAFERGGVRLYEALLVKCQSGLSGGDIVSLDRLKEIHNEEAQHFQLVSDAIESLGGDPTVQTPCADVIGVETMGLVQVLNDPRTTLAQSMNAILTAELSDNAAWELLIALARETGAEDLVKEFEQALAHEEEHLRQVKTWMERLMLAEAKPDTARSRQEAH
jgi:bacterioferritin (cytochrome b1)